MAGCCLGSRPLRINGWQERQGLPRFPLTIRDDRILVEVSQRVIATARMDLQP